MTDFDKTLIAKARSISRWHYRDIDILMDIADTDEAWQQLSYIQQELYDSVLETI